MKIVNQRIAILGKKAYALEMRFNRTEKDLLNLLADEWDKAGPPGYIETTGIAERLQMPVPQVKAAIQSLYEKGVVDTDRVDRFAAYLTPQGYELTRMR